MADKILSNNFSYNTICLYSPVIDIVDRKLAEFVVYAKKKGLEKPKKKQLYNFIIGHHKKVDPAEFFQKLQDLKQSSYYYTTAPFTGQSRVLLAEQLALLLKYAQDKQYEEPTFKDLYNFMFLKLEDLTNDDFFRNQI